VKYHLGCSADLRMPAGPLNVSLMPNPSHLEAVDPVVMGKVRARQHFQQDTEQKQVLGMLIHGDAAFCGQGIVAETLELGALRGYNVGGIVHIVINNQVGFTTNPREARTSAFPTDVAKAAGIPILHVNGDDVEAVVRTFRLAIEWRQTFQKDVVIDLVGYRRNGHNEQDDPTATQPLMYKKIEAHPPLVELYASQLIANGVLSSEEVAAMQQEVHEEYETQYQRGGAEEEDSPEEWRYNKWHDSITKMLKVPGNPTGLPLSVLQDVGNALAQPPHDFTLHPEVAKLLKKRAQMANGTRRVDMPFAEALACGALILDFDPKDENYVEYLASIARQHDVQYVKHPKTHVRLAGQDVERGTFSQRHARFFNQDTGKAYHPFNFVAKNSDRGAQAEYHCFNSNLSEAAALGFEYGYSLHNENALVMWEAQFGDFVNGAQVIIDNFITSGASKWDAASSLVLLLPHGAEGQGPEHSSARLERFLQLVDDDPDELPGLSHQVLKVLREHFEEADSDGDGLISPVAMEDLMRNFAPVKHGAIAENSVILDILGKNLGPEWERKPVSLEEWLSFMKSFLMRAREASSNITIVNPTTPAQYFHVLRRQVHRPFSVPLIVMGPKMLLHHTPASSPLSDFVSGSSFKRVIGDGSRGDNMAEAFTRTCPDSEVRRLILCSGKISMMCGGRGSPWAATMWRSHEWSSSSPSHITNYALRCSATPMQRLSGCRRSPRIWVHGLTWSHATGPFGESCWEAQVKVGSPL